jgi:alanine dehydrogenase
VLALADLGFREALTRDPHLRAGLNVHKGKVTFRGVADALGYPYVDPVEALRE